MSWIPPWCDTVPWPSMCPTDVNISLDLVIFVHHVLNSSVVWYSSLAINVPHWRQHKSGPSNIFVQHVLNSSVVGYSPLAINVPHWRQHKSGPSHIFVHHVSSTSVVGYRFTAKKSDRKRIRKLHYGYQVGQAYNEIHSSRKWSPLGVMHTVKYSEARWHGGHFADDFSAASFWKTIVIHW